jgi:hypothetical protein
VTVDPSAGPSDASLPPADEGSARAGSTAEDDPSGGPPSGGSALPIAVGGGIVAGLLGGIILVVGARRRHEPDPGAAKAAIPEPVDHERLLAEALGARAGRHAGVVAEDDRPAWLRRLKPTAGRPVSHDPEVDDTI